MRVSTTEVVLHRPRDRGALAARAPSAGAGVDGSTRASLGALNPDGDDDGDIAVLRGKKLLNRGSLSDFQT